MSEAWQGPRPDFVLHPHINGEDKVVEASCGPQQQSEQEHQGVLAALAAGLPFWGQLQGGVAFLQGAGQLMSNVAMPWVAPSPSHVFVHGREASSCIDMQVVAKTGWIHSHIHLPLACYGKPGLTCCFTPVTEQPMMRPCRRTPRYHLGPMRLIWTSENPALVNHCTGHQTCQVAA